MMSFRSCFVAGPACALALTGCASTPPPVAGLAAARATIEQAEPAASRYAPEPLMTARAKLARAERAMARRDYAEAHRLAEQAEADAKLAQATADAERMRGALAEVNEGIKVLKQQLDGSRP